MTHRTDVEWIDLDNPPENLKEMLLKCHHNKVVSQDILVSDREESGEYEVFDQH